MAMPHSVGTYWRAVVVVLALALTACSSTSGSSPRPAATTATEAVPGTATPTPPPAPTTAYLGVGNVVYALDARTGSLRWKYDTGQPTTTGNISSLFVSAGTVFFNDYFDSSLYALDAAMGSLRWKLHVVGSADSLIVVSNVVYLTSATVQAPAATYAINLFSGTVLWQHPGGGAMVVTADAAYFANVQPGSDAQPVTNGFVRAYNRLTGSLLWQINGHPFDSLQASGDVIYTTADNTLYAYDAHSGAALWTAPFPSNIIESQLIGDTFYLSDATQAFTLDVTTHKLLWHFTVAYGYMAIGENVVCLANHGELDGLDPTTGAQEWSVQAAEGYASVTYSSGTCYTNTYSTDRAPLYAVDTVTGKLRWSRDIKYIYNALQPTADAIYVISDATAQCCALLVTALSSTDGSTRWTFAPPTSYPGFLVLG